MYTTSKAFIGMGLSLGLGSGSPVTYEDIAEIKNVQRSGSKVDTVDVTNMESVGAYREFIAGLIDGGEFSFSANYIPHDSTQQALQASMDNQTVAPWKLTLPAKSISDSENTTPGFWSFLALVTSFDIDLPTDKEASISAKLKISGKPVFTDESA